MHQNLHTAGFSSPTTLRRSTCPIHACETRSNVLAETQEAKNPRSPISQPHKASLHHGKAARDARNPAQFFEKFETEFFPFFLKLAPKKTSEPNSGRLGFAISTPEIRGPIP